MNVLTSITILGFLIFFHEMGHFLAAILQGIYVDGFSIGFGPSIIQKKYKDITYSLRAFPLGGFCLLYTSPSPRDRTRSRMPSSA